MAYCLISSNLFGLDRRRSAPGRQVSSIYWHLKRIYRKHGRTRQAELVQVVRALLDAA